MDRRVFMSTTAIILGTKILPEIAEPVEIVNYEDIMWIFTYCKDDIVYFSSTYIADKHFVCGFYDGKYLTECPIEESNIIVNGYPDNHSYFKAQIFSPTTFEVF